MSGFWNSLVYFTSASKTLTKILVVLCGKIYNNSKNLIEELTTYHNAWIKNVITPF